MWHHGRQKEIFWGIGFSKQKTIKTYICSWMLQERIGLSTVSVEHEIAQNIDLFLNLLNWKRGK
jgi:hypothetical protein